MGTRSLAVAVVALAGWIGAAHADGWKDAELAAISADAYLEGDHARAGSLDDDRYRELTRIDDAASGVQAVALERRSDHAVVVAYAGTSTGEPVDVLADLGIVAGEVRYLLTDADPMRRGHASPASRKRAALLRARGPTRAMDDQLAVARHVLDQVLAMKDLDGRAITIDHLVITGHSLGGFIVEIVAAERGARGVTFNAPGAEHYAPALRATSVRNLIRRHDVVGTFGAHLGTTEVWNDVARKAAKGDHRPYVYRNHAIADFEATLEQAGA